MPTTKVLARGWKVEIDTGTGGTPTWTVVKGLNTFSFGSGKNSTDTTDFDSAGDNEHLPASRTRTYSAEGFYLEDASTKKRDAGQQAIEDAAALTGPAGVKAFQLTSPGGIKRAFSGSVNISDVGGGNDDATSWGFEVEISGKVTVTSGP